MAKKEKNMSNVPHAWPQLWPQYYNFSLLYPSEPVPNAATIWMAIGFFQEPQLFYFREPLANELTRRVCKALAVEVMANRAEIPEILLLEKEDVLANWLQSKWKELVQEDLRVELFLDFEVWASCGSDRGEKIPAKWMKKLDGRSGDDMAWITSNVEWPLIASRLIKEVAMHGHRRLRRMIELTTGKPFERLECQLGEYAGCVDKIIERDAKELRPIKWV